MDAWYIGVDVGGTKVAYGLFDKHHKLQERRQHPSDTSLSAASFCDVIAAQVFAILAERDIPRGQLEGVGVVVPSFVLFNDGIILKTANIPHLHGFPARTYLSSALNVKVALDNDANAAALAEHRHGAGRGFRHMLYCPISTGIGSGIIINGGLFRGSYGFAGETGHMIIDMESNTFPCQCGNTGCFESHISGSNITRRVAQRLREGEESMIRDLCGGDLNAVTARHIKEACEAGDALGLWALDYMSRYLGVWLYNLYQAFNINCYVFGGGLVHFGDMLFTRVRTVFDTYNASDLPVYFKTAELGEDFGIIGAMELLFDTNPQ